MRFGSLLLLAFWRVAKEEGVHRAETTARVGVSSSHLTASCNLTSRWLPPHIKLQPTRQEF